MNIDKDLLDWLDKQIEINQFSNRSAGIRKCIWITRRIYEIGTPYEIAKFVHGIDRDTVHIKKQPISSDTDWHKCLTKTNHYCINCGCLILPESLCYTNSNNSKHLCTDCKEKYEEHSKT